MKDEEKMIVIGAGSWNPIDIAIDKAMAMHGDVFIRDHNGEPEIFDPSRIMAVDVQKEKITIMKSTQCGMTESIFNNWRINSNERMIENIKGRPICDYVWKSLKMYFLLETK